MSPDSVILSSTTEQLTTEAASQQGPWGPRPRRDRDIKTKSYCLTLLANLVYCSSSTLSAIWFNDVSFAALCRADNGSHFVTHDPSSN